jgi:hypothetical protein
MKQVFLFLLLSLTLPSVSSAHDYTHYRYLLVTGAGGKIYRLNTQTGQIHIIRNNRLVPIPFSATPDLVKGDLYRNEKGKVRKYIGNWRFR